MPGADTLARAGELAGGAWAFASSSWKWLAFAAALAVASGAGGYFKGRSDGRALERAAHAAGELAARDKSDQSAGVAAGERDKDEVAIGAAQEGRDHAIEAADDGGKPSAASNALNCDRVYRAGKISEFPACRGYQGRD